MNPDADVQLPTPGVPGSVAVKVTLTDLTTVAWKQIAKNPEKPTELSDDFEKVAPTETTAGSIKGTIVITLDDETVEVPVNFTIPATT